MSTEVFPLNQGQMKAAEAFFSFLFTPDRYFRLRGPAGVGKTFWLRFVVDVLIPRYFETCQMMGIEPEFTTMEFTATTNKASAELERATKRPCGTIHSFLRLKVVNNYSTGRSDLVKQQNFMVHQNMILFIDEAYMIDSPLLKFLNEGTQNCKIVFIGDDCQLGPVMEKISPITKIEGPSFELTEPMRNADQPVLQDLCNQLRQTVKTGVFNPIQPVEGVIDHLSNAEMELGLEHYFKEQAAAARILAYTNDRVIAYNDHIRDLRNLGSEYTLGECLVNNSSVQIGTRRLSVEAEYEIIKVGDLVQVPVGVGVDGSSVYMDCRTVDLQGQLGDVFNEVKIPIDRDHFSSLIRHYQKKKDWAHYFALKEGYPDLRPREAATVHKAQGSSYDAVFIDLDTISKVKDPSEAARMLYVAFSRARHRVFLYGTLASKYGGILPY